MDSFLSYNSRNECRILMFTNAMYIMEMKGTVVV